MERAQQAFRSWRTVPAPARGAVVKRLGELLTEHKRDLATLISLEVGKITSEALGEVQEMIDICDFAVGLSRQLYGRTMPSERPGHRLMETWHPLGVVGVISAFNFPVGRLVVEHRRRPGLRRPRDLEAVGAGAVDRLPASAVLLGRALSEQGAPADVSQVLVGGAEVGQALVDHPGVALLSATGSTRMGRAVGPARRRAVRTLAAGARREQRRRRRAVGRPRPGHPRHRVLGCRDGRAAVHHDAPGDRPLQRHRRADRAAGLGRTARLPIGNPLASGTLVGPLIHDAAFEAMQSALERPGTTAATVVVGGGRRLADEAPNAYYAEPAIVRIDEQTSVVRAGDLRSDPVRDALRRPRRGHRPEQRRPAGSVVQHLHLATRPRRSGSSSAEGSDCGIVNVNIGTSGAEIGGAFGGEKETGGGRESGSDAWRAYMRRATNTDQLLRRAAARPGRRLHGLATRPAG